MRASWEDVRSNSGWLIGNGKNINFWSDSWNGSNVLDTLNATEGSHPFAKDKAATYIQNRQWQLPNAIQIMFPTLANLLSNVHLSMLEKDDLFIWTPAADGILTLKAAYDFKSCNYNDFDWGKLIWNAHIPASQSLVFWRLLHNKVPTDDNLIIRGIQIPSISRIWKFLSSIMSHNFSSVTDVWTAYKKLNSDQSKLVLLDASISIVNTIWKARNLSRFEDKNITWTSVLNLVKVEVAFTGNTTPKIGSNSVLDFQLLKSFNIKLNPPKAFIVKEFLWHPPVLH
ncbi:uncharacterized protein LOC131650636 [Vicia villosa]|uniref:uncharacterized protein LOC131650636 n=1 Tax=Vicia villosa TaxID=3911 RepID=UPI00273A7791|nr:uncharacterized protein LOC131650636 [Vicia villosa]